MMYEIYGSAPNVMDWTGETSEDSEMHSTHFSLHNARVVLEKGTVGGVAQVEWPPR